MGLFFLGGLCDLGGIKSGVFGEGGFSLGVGLLLFRACQSWGVVHGCSFFEVWLVGDLGDDFVKDCGIAV